MQNTVGFESALLQVGSHSTKGCYAYKADSNSAFKGMAYYGTADSPDSLMKTMNDYEDYEDYESGAVFRPIGHDCQYPGQSNYTVVGAKMAPQF